MYLCLQWFIPVLSAVYFFYTHVNHMVLLLLYYFTFWCNLCFIPLVYHFVLIRVSLVISSDAI